MALRDGGKGSYTSHKIRYKSKYPCLASVGLLKERNPGRTILLMTFYLWLLTYDLMFARGTDKTYHFSF